MVDRVLDRVLRCAGCPLDCVYPAWRRDVVAGSHADGEDACAAAAARGVGAAAADGGFRCVVLLQRARTEPLHHGEQPPPRSGRLRAQLPEVSRRAAVEGDRGRYGSQPVSIPAFDGCGGYLHAAEQDGCTHRRDPPDRRRGIAAGGHVRPAGAARVSGAAEHLLHLSLCHAGATWRSGQDGGERETRDARIPRRQRAGGVCLQRHLHQQRRVPEHRLPGGQRAGRSAPPP